ncbi:MAG: hypothetical protein ACTSRE_09200 [Promethearchaeota archaeon]
MQITKRTHFILSISVVLMVFTSMLCLNLQIKSDNQSDPNIPNASVIAEDLYIEEASRHNAVNQYGVNLVIDSLTFVNNGSEPINYVYYTFNTTYLPYYLGFVAKSQFRTTLSHQEAQHGLFGYKTIIVYLNTPINPMTSQTVDFISYYSGLYTAYFNTTSGQQQIFFNFSIYPFSPYPIYSATSEFELPYRTFFTTYTGTPAESGTSLYYQKSEVTPFSEEYAYVEGTNNQYSSIKFTKITRRIYLNPWGDIRVVEDHSIKNTGDIYTKIFTYKLPTVARNITMYDETGTIDEATFDEEDGMYSISLINRAGINPNATKKYTLEYYMPLDEFFSKSYSVSSLKMDINLMDFNILTEELHTYLHLYAGKSIISSTVLPDSLTYEANSMVLYFHHSNVVGTTNYYLQLEYKESSFQLTARGLLFSALLFLAFSLYAVIRTRTISRSDEDEMVREEIIPESEMREFIAYYEELTAVRIDIKHLESDLSRKKIAKKAYSKQLKVLESKMKTTQDDLKPYKKLILNTGGPIADIVKRLDLREAEIISNQDGIKLYDDRYKKGKLPSKQAYRTLRTQMVDNGEKIQRQIDRLINQMKTYLI